MKELTREELPTDGTHFVVTFVFMELRGCERARIVKGIVTIGWNVVICKDARFSNVRYWEFPEDKFVKSVRSTIPTEAKNVDCSSYWSQDDRCNRCGKSDRACVCY